MKKRLNNLKKLFFLLSINMYLFVFKIVYIVNGFDGKCDKTNGGINNELNASCSYYSDSGNAENPIPNQRAYIAEHVKQWDFTYMNICDVFWNIARFLVAILNELHKGITGLYKSLGVLFSNTSFTSYFDSYNVLIGPIISVVLFFYALYVMFFGMKKLAGFKKGVIMFLFVGIFGSSFISFIATASGDLTETSFTSANNCENMSMGTCIAKNYIIDVPYYASQNNKGGSKNNIDNDYNFDLIQFKDSVGVWNGDNGLKRIDSAYDFGDLNIPMRMDKDGIPIKALGLRDGDWLKAGTNYVSYARYRVNLLALICVLLFMIFAIMGTGFITGLEVFNGLIISGLLPILSAVDIGTGEKTAKAFKMLGMIFANIFLYSVVISFYSVWIKYITGMQIHWITQLFLIGGSSVGLFNLRSLIAKIFGIERPQDSNILQRLYYGSRMFGAGKRAISGVVNRAKGVVQTGASFAEKGMDFASGGTLGANYDTKKKGFSDKMSDLANRNRMDYERKSPSKVPKEGTLEYLRYQEDLMAKQEEMRDNMIVKDAVNFINDDSNSRDDKQLKYLEYEQAQKRISERYQERSGQIKNLAGYNFGGEKDGTVKRDLMNRPVYVKNKNEKPTYSNPVKKEQQSRYNNMNNTAFNNKKPMPHQEMVDFDNMPSKAPLSDQELQDFLNEYGDVLKK